MKLPPKFVVAPAQLVYGDLPRAVLLTAIRIWGLGWRHHYERTDPISEKELCEICGVRRSQLYEHVVRLTAEGILRYATADRRWTFWFETIDCANPENRTDRTIHDGDVDSVPDSDHQQQVLSIHGARQSGKPDSAILELLDEIGISEPTRSEIACLDWVDCAYLEEWRNWHGAQDHLGVGWIVTQMRAGMRAPIVRSRIEDGRAYVTGEYGHLIRS